MLHEYLLAMLGLIVGKLWDLEELAKTCAEKRRWTFFASAPLNMAPGIGLPANGLVVFYVLSFHLLRSLNTLLTLP
jgi:hypothetical protein